MQFNAYTISLLVSALVTGALAVYAFMRRDVNAGTELALVLFAICA